MTPAVFLVLAAIAALGLLRTLRGQAASRRYLEASPPEAPLELGHLSVPLRRVALETRALRLTLDEPLRLVQGAERLLGSDHALADVERELLDASRDLGIWVRMVEQLSPADRATMRDMGAHPEPVRDALAAEGWSLELGPRPVGDPLATGWPGKRARGRRTWRTPRGEPLSVRLLRIVQDLERIERHLQIPPDPYR